MSSGYIQCVQRSLSISILVEGRVSCQEFLMLHYVRPIMFLVMVMANTSLNLIALDGP